MNQNSKTRNSESTAEQFQQNIGTVVSALRLLAHPLRLSLLCHILDGPLTVNELVAATAGNQSQVSQFLKALRAEGLVDFKKKGASSVYYLKDNRVGRLVRELKRIYCKSSPV